MGTLLNRRPDGPPSAPSDLLILSDLHIGGALRAPMDFAARRRVARLDRALCDFLEHHAAHPPPEGPWTLVLNGDTIDFMHFDLRPPRPLPEGEALYGLDLACGRSRWKLATIAAWHRRFFAGLYRFLAAGHTCVFVVGNHDVDLAFPAIRADLIEHILAHAPSGERAAVAGRIRVAPWFYFEKGRVNIEHGHRFDPYATFPDPLSPVVRGRPGRLAPSFSHLALRFFANRIRSLPLHDLDRWGFMDFVRWGFGRAGMNPARIFMQLLYMAWRCARATAGWRHAPSDTQPARLAKLRAFARRHKLSLDVTHALDALRARPIGATLGGILQALYLDRITLGLAAVVAVPLSSAYSEPSWSLPAPALVLAAALAVFLLLGRLRPSPDAHVRLGQMARRIARLTGARVVVFGHTHRVVPDGEADGDADGEADGDADGDAKNAGGARWLNPGAWEHVGDNAPHRAGEPCTCTTRYATLTGRGPGTRAEVRRWCRRTRT